MTRPERILAAICDGAAWLVLRDHAVRESLGLWIGRRW